MATPGKHRQEFRFGLGHLTLEFLATLAGRVGEPFERLASPRDLEDWLAEAGLVTPARCNARLLADARALREGIYRTLDAARNGLQPASADIALINAWARRPPPAPQLDRRFQPTWTADASGRAALAELARSAVELLTGAELARVRNCARTGCSRLFIDRSRPGRRRWCSMARCGNRTKTARYRQRHPRVRA
jgi:predicted RNA-binding Zn ribbon-like protein